MIDSATFAKWQNWSKRDDAFRLLVPSDVRQMLGEITRLRVALLNAHDYIFDDTRVDLSCEAVRKEIEGLLGPVATAASQGAGEGATPSRSPTT